MPHTNEIPSMSDELQKFAEIAPVDDAHFQESMARLVKEPGLAYAVKYVMPEVDYPELVKFLLSVKDKYTFQRQVMWPFMEMLAKKTTSGVSISGLENVDPDKGYTFITNHRDIVLDAAFLNICFFRSGRRSCEVAIGSNLLIFDWISTLVRINNCFIVKRGGRRLEALDDAKELSAYIHHTIGRKGESVWIAQREGRAKDSSDRTQESLIKMLALDGDGSAADNLLGINLTPVSITYEYDPNDYLKAREFLLKRRDPDFKKSQRDDLFSMETGLLQYKGRVHFSIGKCLNPELQDIPAGTPRAEILAKVCGLIDRSIHSGYKIYAINYIAHDLLHHDRKYEMLYTAREKEAFETYIEHQLDKVEASDVTPEERNFMREMMFTMYANPLKNKVAALNHPDD